MPFNEFSIVSCWACFYSIPGGKLDGRSNRIAKVEKICENVGIIKKVVVEMNDRDIWYLEDLTITTPKDLAKPNEMTSVKLKV